MIEREWGKKVGFRHGIHAMVSARLLLVAPTRTKGEAP